jgi:imidazole glycerol phosphate synthase glutamine amidotransferase subunit
LRSVQNTLEEIGAEFAVTSDPEVVSKAEKLVLPGVGHFGQMTQALDALGLRTSVLGRIAAGVPFLGICVGLQCLFEASEESPGARGLGVFPGEIRRFSGDARVPHMGWNSLEQTRPSRLLRGLDGPVFTYFAHSYYAPVADVTAATCTYLHPYTAVIERDNIHAVQFHPEKSGAIGLRVLRNFVEL